MAMSGGQQFEYQAVDGAGNVSTGQISAKSQREAYRVLESKGLTPLTLNIGAQAAQAGRWAWLRRERTSEKEDALLMEQLALLLCAGIPLLNAIVSLRGQSAPAYAERLGSVERRLRAGEAFAPTLTAAFPQLPSYMGQLAAAGEATGRLGPALRDGVVQMNYDLAVRQDMNNALTYPAILVVTGLGAVMFIFTVVVPRFSTMLAGKMDQLPMISKIVINLGLALNEAKGVILLLAAAAAYGLWRASKLPAVRQKVRDLLDRAPLVGVWLLESELARWGSMLSTLLANGVDLIRGLQFAREAVTLERLSQKLLQVSKLVRGGQSLSTAIASQDIFTPTAVSLIQVGEASGELATILKSMADLYANSGRQRMKRFLIMLEPIAILLIGGVIGGIVAAIMLAITSVNQVAL
ncbi:MAG: type II secretion system F family protein [Rhodospirillaceae bacterium]|nr:type II secretion system F family protein [Rhodospirillaceae bacterium]